MQKLPMMSVTHTMPHMITREELAAMLHDVNVEDVAREAGCATKTIYRLRHQQHSPTLDTVARIVAAVERLRAQTQQAA